MSCLHFASRTARAQDSYQFRVSYDLWCGADTAPPFYAYPGRISNNPHESMETRCVPAFLACVVRDLIAVSESGLVRFTNSGRYLPAANDELNP